MALVSINARGHMLKGANRLRSSLLQDVSLRSVTIMIHGYRFCPDMPDHDPHRHILSLRPQPGRAKAISWPRHLRLQANDSLGIGFGWSARGRLDQAYAAAAEAGAGLAEMITMVASERPDLPIHVLAHSLGARVALTALPHLDAGMVTRIALLTGAEYRGPAEAALETPAGQSTQILNVTSGENRPFDLAFRAFARPGLWPEPPIAEGLTHAAPNWCDLRLDAPAHRDALAALGHRLTAPARRYCHWSTYLRPGIFGLYRRYLSPRGGQFHRDLQMVLASPPERVALPSFFPRSAGI